MEKLIINTGLDRFLLVACITEVNERFIQGVSMPIRGKAYLLVESMAQLGAMHVRFCSNFTCHAFLSGVANFYPAEDIHYTEIFHLTGVLQSRSTVGFSYTIAAETKSGQGVSGDFLFATTPYDDRFQESSLKLHYEKVFSCLQSASPGK